MREERGRGVLLPQWLHRPDRTVRLVAQRLAIAVNGLTTRTSPRASSPSLSLSLAPLSCVHSASRDLYGLTISGTIPPDVGEMKNLTYLNLNHLSISGTMPREIADLHELTQMAMTGNQISGTIPSELGNMWSLTLLLLSDNKLTGAGSGICALNERLHNCDLSFNPNWTDSSLCPSCLDEPGFACYPPPINCTG